MDAKLIKDSDGYWLDISDDGITKRPLTDFGQLSIKNCEAIENGYDLDELAEERTKNQLIRLLGFENKEEVLDDIQKRKFYFIEGAKAILELLGDKKFTQENMIDAMITTQVSDSIHTNQDRLDFIQSLQQTEWDVEIVTKPYTEVGEGFELELKREPKLDKDGCLILRRK